MFLHRRLIIKPLVGQKSTVPTSTLAGNEALDRRGLQSLYKVDSCLGVSVRAPGQKVGQVGFGSQSVVAQALLILFKFRTLPQQQTPRAEEGVQESPLSSPLPPSTGETTSCPIHSLPSRHPNGRFLRERDYGSDSPSLFSKGHWERVKCVAGQIHRSPMGKQDLEPGAALSTRQPGTRTVARHPCGKRPGPKLPAAGEASLALSLKFLTLLWMVCGF